jgi:hypothetical protein
MERNLEEIVWEMGMLRRVSREAGVVEVELKREVRDWMSSGLRVHGGCCWLGWLVVCG